jgi:uncharacterized membrane protein YesL
MKQLFKILEIITAFFQLNLLWLLFCLPIVTIFPATVALYCVVRQWILHNDYSVFRSFFQFFKQNFKQSFLLGVIWSLFICLLFMNFLILNNFGSFQHLLFTILSVFGLVVLFITIYIFPTIANYNVNWLTAIKNSLFFSIRYFYMTIAIIILLVLTLLLLVTWPITFMFIFCVFAFCHYHLCNVVFYKIQQKQSS